jgi:hypothetical protein
MMVRSQYELNQQSLYKTPVPLRFRRPAQLRRACIDLHQRSRGRRLADLSRRRHERISIFNQGGGFVFNAIHNIRGNVPLEMLRRSSGPSETALKPYEQRSRAH